MHRCGAARGARNSKVRPPAQLQAAGSLVSSRHGRYSAGWYFGFAIGGSGLWTQNAPEFAGADSFGLSVAMRVGMVVQPWMLVGIDASAMGFKDERGAGYVGVAATFYPLAEAGLYLIGGIGMSMLTVPDRWRKEKSRSVAEGVDLLAGIGYELPFRKNSMVMTAELRGQGSWGNNQQFAGGALRLGLSWYLLNGELRPALSPPRQTGVT